MRVILLGAPGSGKGSVGDLVRSAYGFPKISTGDLLREAVQKKTPLGQQAATQMGKGGLVDDAIVLKLLEERLAGPDCREGYTLDGYPRNLSQARSLEGLDGGQPEVVFLIETREDVVIRRLATRRVCPSCGAIYNVITRKPAREGVCDVCGASLVQRTDDRPDVIQERMRTYHAKTEPLIAHYQEKGVLHRVEGNGTVEETFQSVRDILDDSLRRAKEPQARP
jgi:adenylate kinase